MGRKSQSKSVSEASSEIYITHTEVDHAAFAWNPQYENGKLLLGSLGIGIIERRRNDVKT